jgi:hypothetical protein
MQLKTLQIFDEKRMDGWMYATETLQLLVETETLQLLDEKRMDRCN